MKILNHPQLPIYLLLAFCLLLCGIWISFLLYKINITQPSTVNWSNSLIFIMTNFQIFQTIFIKNLIATFLIISLGIIGFRLIPALCIMYNGYLIGNTISDLNYNFNIIFATIFPHGYYYLPEHVHLLLYKNYKKPD
jgi:uncharacterized membrane protein SpoIIM required for sporulation